MKVNYCGLYRTDIPADKGDWATDYWATVKTKQMIKREKINGTFQMNINGVLKTYRNDDRIRVLTFLTGAIAKGLAYSIKEKFCIVPVPGHDLTDANDRSGATFKYAANIAAQSNGQISVEPILSWHAAQEKQRGDSGVRSWIERYEPMQVAKHGCGKVVIFDDILTSGSTLLAAERRLSESGYHVLQSVTFLKASRSGIPTFDWMEENIVAEPYHNREWRDRFRAP